MMEPMKCMDCGSSDVHSSVSHTHNIGTLRCGECGAEYYVFMTKGVSVKSAHREHFGKFFSMSIKEMDRNFPEKGDSWLEQDDAIIEKHYGPRKIPMNRHLTLGLENTFHRFMERGEVEYLKHLGNFCAMVRLRKLLKEEK